MILDTEPTPEQRRALLAAQVDAHRRAEAVETTCTSAASRRASAVALLRAMGRRRGDSALHVAGRLYLEHGELARDVVAAGVELPAGVDRGTVDAHLARTGARKSRQSLHAGRVSTRLVDMNSPTELHRLVMTALHRIRAEQGAGPRRLVDLAELLGVRTATLQKLLRGERRLHRASAGRVTGETLAEALGLQVDEIMAAAELHASEPDAGVPVEHVEACAEQVAGARRRRMRRAS